MKIVSKRETTWKDVVRHALMELGGTGHLRDINGIVKNHPKTKTNPTWRDTIRRVVRQYSIFEPVGAHRSGKYRLVDHVEGTAEPGHIDRTDHSAAQGMLLALGRLYGYETFAPAPDRNSREFQGQPLASFTTVNDCSGFCKGVAVGRVRQIDAIWLDEDTEGPFPVYAFEVEHTTKVRSGLDRLVEVPGRFHAQLFVVAPGDEEKALFERLVEESRFRKFRNRLAFRDYKELETLYNAAVTHDTAITTFGVKPRPL